MTKSNKIAIDIGSIARELPLKTKWDREFFITTFGYERASSASSRLHNMVKDGHLSIHGKKGSHTYSMSLTQQRKMIRADKDIRVSKGCKGVTMSDPSKYRVKDFNIARTQAVRIHNEMLLKSVGLL